MLEFTKNDTLFTGDQILKEFWDCLECGLCCKIFSEIPTFRAEMKELTEYVSIDEKRFIKYYLEYNKNSQTQNELMLKTPCHFQENNRCIVHKKKPLVCRMFPLCINITTGKGILSGIYLCPQATQFYEGLIDYNNKYNSVTFQKLISIEKNLELTPMGWKIQGPSTLFTKYIDWLYRNDTDL